MKHFILWILCLNQKRQYIYLRRKSGQNTVKRSIEECKLVQCLNISTFKHFGMNWNLLVPKEGTTVRTLPKFGETISCMCMGCKASETTYIEVKSEIKVKQMCIPVKLNGGIWMRTMQWITWTTDNRRQSWVGFFANSSTQDLFDGGIFATKRNKFVNKSISFNETDTTEF